VHAPAPSAVALPRNTDEVARLLRACHEAGVAVVPSGGRTGLAGGAMAKDGEIVLSLARMRRVRTLDPANYTLTAEGGCVPYGEARDVAEQALRDAGLDGWEVARDGSYDGDESCFSTWLFDYGQQLLYLFGTT